MRLVKIIIQILIIQSICLSANDYKWVKRGVMVDPGNFQVSPDGKYCALAARDNSYSDILVYSIENSHVKFAYINKHIQTFLFHWTPFEFSVDSKDFIYPVLAETKDYQICRIVNIESRDVVSEHNFTKEDFDDGLQIHSIYALNSDNILIILSNFSKSRIKFCVWDHINDKILISKEINGDPAQYIKANRTSKSIAVLSESKEIFIYSTEDLSQIGTWKLETETNDYIRFMDISEKGGYVAVSIINNGGDAQIRIYDIQNGNLLNNFKEDYFDMAFSYNACFIDNDQKIIYPRAADYKIIDLKDTTNYSTYSLSCGGSFLKTINSDRLISYSLYSGFACVMDLLSGNFLYNLNPFRLAIDFVDFSRVLINR